VHSHNQPKYKINKFNKYKYRSRGFNASIDDKSTRFDNQQKLAYIFRANIE